MPVSEHRLISLRQSIVTFTSRSLLVLPAAVDQQRRGDDQRQTQHANVDSMTSDETRTIQHVSMKDERGGNLTYASLER